MPSDGCRASFAAISAVNTEQKLDSLRAHMSQVLKNGLVDLEALEAQARYHGFRCRKRYAEAFEIDRFLLDLGPLGQDAAEERVVAEPLDVPSVVIPTGTLDRKPSS